jgi:hypothetical protein
VHPVTVKRIVPGETVKGSDFWTDYRFPDPGLHVEFSISNFKMLHFQNLFGVG